MVETSPTFWSKFSIPNISGSNLEPVSRHSPLVDHRTFMLVKNMHIRNEKMKNLSASSTTRLFCYSDCPSWFSLWMDFRIIAPLGSFTLTISVSPPINCNFDIQHSLMEVSSTSFPNMLVHLVKNLDFSLSFIQFTCNLKYKRIQLQNHSITFFH